MNAFAFPNSEIAPQQDDIACQVLIKIDQAISAQEDAKEALATGQIEQRFKATQQANATMDEIEEILMSFATPSLYMAFESTSLSMAANNVRINVSNCQSSAREALEAIKSLRTTWTAVFPDAEINAFASQNSVLGSMQIHKNSHM